MKERFQSLTAKRKEIIAEYKGGLRDLQTKLSQMVDLGRMRSSGKITQEEYSVLIDQEPNQVQ